MWLLGLLGFGITVALPLLLLSAVFRQDRDLRAMRGRLADLEARLARMTTPEAVPPPPDPAQLPEPIPLPERPATATVESVSPSAPSSVRAPEPEPASARASARRGGAAFEQLVGGVWLQHAGSVLILFGAFFLILWGYTTGRLGAGALVVAGAAVGLATAWRGDRVAQSLPGFGQALVGVGLGIVYLALYLGHFVLHAVPGWLAFTLLALVSLGTVAAGLRHRAQAIAAIGLIGAFIPVLLPRIMPERGFSMAPHEVLGYAALIDAVVFALAARAGWSMLSLGALALTATTWIAAVEVRDWGWGIQSGLSLLFVALGLAPLPRLASVAGRVSTAALAVIAAAPLCLIAASWPFLARAAQLPSAVYLVVLAILYLVAALWIDGRRPERDLWRPLTAAATLFLTAALQRALGPEHTPMAWCVEGAVLIELGLGPRRSWLRLLGQTVLFLGAAWVFVTMLDRSWTRDLRPVLNAGSIRDLIAIAAMGVAALRLATRRDPPSETGRVAAEIWSAAANLMLMVWGAREASMLAQAIENPRLPVPESVGGTPLGRRIGTLSAVLTSGAWTLQALVLVLTGWASSSGFLRWLGMGLLALVVLKLVFADLQQVDVFWRFLLAIVLGAALLGVSYLYQRRERRP